MYLSAVASSIANVLLAIDAVNNQIFFVGVVEFLVRIEVLVMEQMNPVMPMYL
jgi:hypothetical protein